MLNINDDLDYMLLMMGKNIIQNDTKTIRAIVGYTDNKNFDEKKIITKATLNSGDYLTINNHKYLIENEINDSKYDSYYKAYARSTTYDIKFNFNGTIKAFPSLIDTQSFDIQTGQFLITPIGKILVTLQSNADSENIALAYRFYFAHKAYRVVGIDKSKGGLIKLYCDLDTISLKDDVENNIANRWEYETKHTYTINVIPNAISIFENITKQIAVAVTDDAVAVANPVITYTSDNTNIATVDNTGLVKGIIAGRCNILASFTGLDNKAYTKIIPTTVYKVEPTHNYTYDINSLSGTLVIKQTQTYTFTPHKYDNSVEVDTLWDFTINYGTLAQTAIIILEKTDTYIRIKGNAYSGTFLLRATERGTTNYVEKTITLESAFYK